MLLKAVLFDFGGTLDSDGIPWLDRFLPLYREVLDVPAGTLTAAFYASDDELPLRHDLERLNLEQTVQRQVAGVLERLAPDRPELTARIARRFSEDSRRKLSQNLNLLKSLRSRFKLGVVSNFYGNLESILAGEGFAGVFRVVADSAKVGARKPDPRIFLHAAKKLQAAPSEILMVGDSLTRDMKGAEALGMAHAWLCSVSQEPCCSKAIMLRGLADLETALAAALAS